MPVTRYKILQLNENDRICTENNFDIIVQVNLERDINKSVYLVLRENKQDTKHNSVIFAVVRLLKARKEII